MNTNVLHGNLRQFVGKIKEKWGNLTDDEIMKTEGKFEKLYGLVQEKHGVKQDEFKSYLQDIGLIS
jgi:uncharacterized protein YjbJ (UPF0337 family)